MWNYSVNGGLSCWWLGKSSTQGGVSSTLMADFQRVDGNQKGKSMTRASWRSTVLYYINISYLFTRYYCLYIYINKYIYIYNTHTHKHIGKSQNGKHPASCRSSRHSYRGQKLGSQKWHGLLLKMNQHPRDPKVGAIPNWELHRISGISCQTLGSQWLLVFISPRCLGLWTYSATKLPLCPTISALL